jgi:pre-rRNA-processing protein TSR3
MHQIRIYIIHLWECDVRRCTAIKLRKFDLVDFIRERDSRAKGAIFLDPFAERAVSREDRMIIEQRGLAALDGSWNKISKEKFMIYRRKYEFRALPYLVAGNPTHYGMPTKLSTVEALSFALYITGFEGEALKLLKIFSWGINAFKLNQNLLQMYSEAKTSKEVIELQNEFLEVQERVNKNDLKS